MTGTPALLVDAILVLIAVEAAILWRWSGRRSTRARPAIMLVLASGACLLLAVRAALAGSGSALLAALTCAGIVHVAWLIASFRRQR